METIDNPNELEALSHATDLLGEVCDYSPRRMTLEELQRALPARGSRMDADDVDVAARHLEAHGLVRRDAGGYLTPTLAGDASYLLLVVVPQQRGYG